MSTLLNGTTPSMSPPNNSLDSIGLIIVLFELVIVELIVLIVVGPFDVDAGNVVVDSLFNINLNYYK